MSNTLIVLSGPSGVGKGTIVKRLLEKGGFELSVSCTTRAPRAGEKDGVSYFFIPRDRFTQLIREGGFLEYSEHFGNYYGTPKFFVESKLKTRDVILEIDVDGALAVKKGLSRSVTHYDSAARQGGAEKASAFTRHRNRGGYRAAAFPPGLRAFQTKRVRLCGYKRQSR